MTITVLKKLQPGIPWADRKSPAQELADRIGIIEQWNGSSVKERVLEPMHPARFPPHCRRTKATSK